MSGQTAVWWQFEPQGPCYHGLHPVTPVLSSQFLKSLKLFPAFTTDGEAAASKRLVLWNFLISPRMKNFQFLSWNEMNLYWTVNLYKAGSNSPRVTVKSRFNCMYFFLSSVEFSSVQWNSARETLYTAEASTSWEVSHTDRAIQGTWDFLSVVYPFNSSFHRCSRTTFTQLRPRHLTLMSRASCRPLKVPYFLD